MSCPGPSAVAPLETFPLPQIEGTNYFKFTQSCYGAMTGGGDSDWKALCRQVYSSR
jgi:hypothetical protein